MRILFITASHLGDAVLSTGILGWLIERHPGAQITVACGRLPAPLFRTAPGVVDVIELTKGPWAAHWRHLWARCVGTRWDLIVDLRNTPVSRLLRAKKRIVWRKHALRVHKVTELANVVGAVPLPAPRLWLRQSMARPDIAEPFVAIAPGSRSAGKTWPAERYAALGTHLTAENGILPGGLIVLFGDKNDRAIAADIVFNLPWAQTVDLTGIIDIEETAALLSRAKFFVGNDSGLTHLAAAAGVPTLALFGPGIPWKYRPWGDRAAYISKAEDPAREYDLCRDGNDEAALELMRRIGVEDAVQAAEQLWRKVNQ